MMSSPSHLAHRIIGRDKEIAVGEALLARAAEGEGSFLFVTGDAGIGKSRLAAALRERARERGFRTLVGVCQEYDSDFPFAPFLDALRQWLAPLDHPAASLGGDRALFARLLPELADPAMPPPASLPPEHEKRRLFEAFVRLFTRLEAQAPLVVVLEDIHWADEASLELLHLLPRRVAARLFIIVTARSDEPGRDLGPWYDTLDRNRLARRLDLAPLDADAASRMIATLSARPLPAATVAKVRARADGNPFFIEELLRVLPERAGDQSNAVGPGETLPASVRETVLRRFDALDAGARRVAETAAVIGRRFAYETVRAVTGLDDGRTTRALRQMVDAHLVREVREATRFRFEFRHALTREAIASRLLTRERRALHERVARELATQDGPAAPSESELGYHWYAAEQWERALVHCRRAGDQAFALCLPHAAIEQFSHALTAAGWLGLPAFDIMEQRGQAYLWIADLARAQDDLEAALMYARDTGDRAAECRLLIALASLRTAHDHRAPLTDLESALAVARAIGDPALLARCYSQLGRLLIFQMRQSDALDVHERALAIREELGDPRGIAEALENLGYAYYVAGDVVRGAASHQRGLALYEGVGDRHGMCACLNGLAECGATLQTDYVVSAITLPETAAAGDRALALAQENGLRFMEARVYAWLGFCVGAQGHFTRAMAYARDAAVIGDETGHDALRFFGHGVLGTILLEMRASKRALASLEAAVAWARELNSGHYRIVAHGYLASAHLLAGNFAQADAILREELAVDTPMTALAHRRAWVARAEYCLATGDADGALHLADRLIAEAPSMGERGEGAIARIALLRGEALTMLGRWEEAETTLRAAVAGAEEQGARALLWRARCALGALLAARAREAEAALVYSAAQTLITDLAREIDEDDLRETFTRSALALVPRRFRRTERQATTARYGGLTERERDIATHVAAGMTNRQIADALFLSSKTVELHLSRVRKKLGLQTRTDVAVWAHDTGLHPADAAATRAG
ncbi:MAG: helix-turn-helix transcriptional regulator [Thermomicrobiales bacterium]